LRYGKIEKIPSVLLVPDMGIKLPFKPVEAIG
jgi:hypothetical protein